MRNGHSCSRLASPSLAPCDFQFLIPRFMKRCVCVRAVAYTVRKTGFQAEVNLQFDLANKRAFSRY